MAAIDTATLRALLASASGAQGTRIQVGDSLEEIADILDGLNAGTINFTDLVADTVTVDDEAYNSTNWDGDLTVPTKNAVRDKIETLAPAITTFGAAYTGTVESVTTEANLTTHALSGVVVPAGGRVLVIVGCMVSHGTANGGINIRIRRDSSGLGFWKTSAMYRASTGGGEFHTTLCYLETPGAGTYTYGLRAFTSSGTMYVRIMEILVIVF